jgi:hypothetical protein
MKIYELRYSQAKAIAETVKDAYRDLLSPIDRALVGRSRQSVPSDDNGSSGGDLHARTNEVFRGKLSVGVDAITNSLVVSAEGENLMQEIGKTILELDEAARSASTLQVLRLDGRVNPSELQWAIRSVLGDSSTRAANVRRPRSEPVDPPPTSVQNLPPRRHPQDR